MAFLIRNLRVITSLSALLALLLFGFDSFSQPLNDDFANAIALSINSYCSSSGEFSTLGATPDEAIPSKWSNGPNSNVWFKFQATMSEVSILVTPDGGLKYPRLALHDHLLNEIVSVGNDGIANGVGLSHTTLIIGEWYFINVSNGLNNGHEGGFILCVDNAASQDYPSGAVEVLHVNDNCSPLGAYSTRIGTPDGLKPSKWGNGPNANVWFKFQATTSEVSLDLKTDGVEGDLLYPKLSLHNASLVELVSINSDGQRTDVGLSHQGLVIGSWYYINIDNGANNGHRGTFTLCIDNETSHDYSSSAIALNDLDSYCSPLEAFTTTIGTPDGAKPASWLNGPSANVWFTFLANGPSVTIDLKTGADEGSLLYPKAALHDVSLNALVSDDNGSTTDIQLMYSNLIQGERYYINVDNGANQSHRGTFTLCVNNPGTSGLPNAPSLLQVSAITPASATLIWSDNSIDETGFEIERSTILGSGYTLVHSTGPDVTTYTDTGLSSGATYYYRVKAVNSGGGSNYTDELAVPTPFSQTNSSVYVNFGLNNQAPSPWNNTLSVPAQGVYLENLLDATGSNTGIRLEITSNWSGTYDPVFNDGAVTGDDSGIYPDAVIEEYYYFGYFGVPDTVTLELSGLDPSGNYDLIFFGSSIWNGVLDNGSTVYTVNGQSATLDVQGNNIQTVTLSDLSPDAIGELEIKLSEAAGSPLGYINAMVLGASQLPTDSTTTYLIDLGNPSIPTSGNWNNVTVEQSSGVTISDLIDTEGVSSSIGLEVVTEADNGYGNGVGYNSVGYDGAALGYPATANSDSYFAYGPGGIYKLTGLDPTKGYDIKIFGSRVASDGRRVGTYRINGVTQTLDAENNSTTTITFAEVLPDTNNEIILEFGVQIGSNFGYINVLEVVEKNVDVILAPGTLTATLSLSNQVDLSWEDRSSNESGFKVERRELGAVTYAEIADLSLGSTSYSDSDLPYNTTYEYRVLAYKLSNGFTLSLPSNEASLTTGLASEGVIDTSRIYINFTDVLVSSSPTPWNHFSSTGLSGISSGDLLDHQGLLPVLPCHLLPTGVESSLPVEC
ncbi:MAG: fibronectin type III domain-containing protein [Bacteroidota bacterium]